MRFIANNTYALMFLYSYALSTCALMPCALVLFFRTKDFVRRIHLFMQNKANFKKVKFNVSKEMKRDYEQMDTWSIRKKQSQTKPNKPKSKKAKMNVKSIITKDYERIINWAIYENKANSNPNKANFGGKKCCQKANPAL